MTRAVLGLPAGKIIVRPYSPEWPQLFAEEQQRLQAVLGERALAIEHIGSTAVPGLAAKPVLDIGVAVADFDTAFETVPLIEGLGYTYRGENGVPRRHFFVKGLPRTHHLHMFEPDHPDWQRVIAFRETLRQDPKLALEYAQLKRRLAQQYAEDSDAYTEAKSAFILAAVGETG